MKILHICKQLNGGGVERVIYNYISSWKNTEDDFYIVKHVQEQGILEEPLNQLGCKIEYIVPKSRNTIGYVKSLYTLIKKYDIEVVHCHQGYMSFFPLLIAWGCGVKKRIAHGHTAFEKETAIRKCYRKICTILTRFTATDLCACGETAGNWMWKKQYQIFPNVLPIEKYYYNPEMREKIRKELFIQDTQKIPHFVVGCISRLAPGKNHDFLLEIFSCIKKRKPEAVLIIAGDGSRYKEIQEMIQKKQLETSVMMLGNREDVPDLLNAFDAFVLPTEYEGLGICLIEAQMNGLPVFTSKGAVPKETAVTSNIAYISLEKTPEEWAEKIISGKRKELSEQEKEGLGLYQGSIQVEKLRRLYEK